MYVLVIIISTFCFGSKSNLQPNTSSRDSLGPSGQQGVDEKVNHLDQQFWRKADHLLQHHSSWSGPPQLHWWTQRSKSPQYLIVNPQGARQSTPSQADSGRVPTSSRPFSRTPCTSARQAVHWIEWSKCCLKLLKNHHPNSLCQPMRKKCTSLPNVWKGK